MHPFLWKFGQQRAKQPIEQSRRDQILNDSSVQQRFMESMEVRQQALFQHKVAFKLLATTAGVLDVQVEASPQQP